MAIKKRIHRTPSIATFRAEAKISMPSVGKTLMRKGKVVAFYDPMTKKVMVPKKPFKIKKRSKR